MPNLLALETSSHACSVTLALQDSTYDFFQVAERQHAALILPAIEDLLKQADCSLASLDAIAFSAGPGSFTGIRLAASVAQGLAFAANLPLIPISTLQVLAQSALMEHRSENVLVLLNAYGGEVYWGAYQQVAGFMQATIPDQRCKPESVFWQENIEWLAIGDGWEAYAPALPSPLPTKIDAKVYPRAHAVAQLAQRDFSLGKFVHGENALPNYLHSASYWKKL